MADKASATLPGFGKPGTDEGDDEDAGTLAGKALIKAIKSGDGAAVREAFESLLVECDRAGETEDEPVDEDEE